MEKVKNKVESIDRANHVLAALRGLEELLGNSTPFGTIQAHNLSFLIAPIGRDVEALVAELEQG